MERLEEHLQDYKNASHYEEGSHSVECGPLGSKHPGTNGMCRIDQEELFGGRYKLLSPIFSYPFRPL